MAPLRLQVNYWLQTLIDVKSNDLYRMKGVLAIEGFDRRFVFQVRGREVGVAAGHESQRLGCGFLVQLHPGVTCCL